MPVGQHRTRYVRATAYGTDIKMTVCEIRVFLFLGKCNIILLDVIIPILIYGLHCTNQFKVALARSNPDVTLNLPCTKMFICTTF